MFAHSSVTNQWIRLGNTLVGAAPHGWCGEPVSMSADDMTVAVGTPHNDDNGGNSGRVRVFTYSPTTKKQNILGNALVGTDKCNKFGKSLSMSADGMTVAVGTPHNDDNGGNSGHVRVFTYDPTTNK